MAFEWFPALQAVPLANVEKRDLFVLCFPAEVAHPAGAPYIAK